MNLLKSVKERFGGKTGIFTEEDLEGFNAPEYFNILLERARDLYFESSYFSISLLQERFEISFQTAARVMDQLEEEGLFEDEEGEEWEEEWEGDI